ncbi:pentatricopeptide repeat-containing protein [Corchorus olitorius]|uniref:Pentatricopeptide repeat-containing protein n=1 Tax=Corchorus olitorius TaxID=93759 RepID=A0A1R3JZM5_9ROSI|nr:pentatricopeptide repeat-containing protein [Corchorus olitorius]
MTSDLPYQPPDEPVVAPISLEGRRVFVEREWLEGKRVDESLLFLGEDSVGGFQCGVFLWVELLVHMCEMSWPL